MLARLIGETEEPEEDEGTHDERPAVKLKEGMREGVGFPNDARDLLDSAIVRVGVGPAHPRLVPKPNVDNKNPSR